MMEASSPCAALQPTTFAAQHYGCRADTVPFHASGFHFKATMSSQDPGDYFSQAIRGSSPTASLAADLSRNFHIDQSPQLPTPRRNLFVSSLFAGLDGRGNATTPPIPSSSPGPNSDSMDISPLPHKAPYSSCFELRLQSPTLESTAAESSFPSVSSPPSSDPPLEPPVLAIPLERRKPGPLRPHLSRTKCLSTTSIPQKPNHEVQLPPFRFGGGVMRPAIPSALTLAEAFAESPPQEKPVLRAVQVMGPPRLKQPFSFGSNNRSGSPIGGHVRKSSNPMVRPRKQFRRSLSMYEHPEDVIRQDKATMVAPLLPAIMDIEVAYVPQLPHFVPNVDMGDLPRISKETLIGVLDGQFNHVYEKLVIVDCRFEYEYEGGHINGAVNFNDKEHLASQLFDVEPTSRALLIFHCEYSAHRAPMMAKFVRNKDRKCNEDRYPNLTYPETYILDGGYSSFFKDYRSRCFPQNYVEMEAKDHVYACERGLGKVKQRSKLLRAQTFAFGQRSSPSMGSSPTAPNRVEYNTTMDMEMDLGTDIKISMPPPRPYYNLFKGHAQRMSSY